MSHPTLPPPYQQFCPLKCLLLTMTYFIFYPAKERGCKVMYQNLTMKTFSRFKCILGTKYCITGGHTVNEKQQSYISCCINYRKLSLPYFTIPYLMPFVCSITSSSWGIPRTKENYCEISSKVFFLFCLYLSRPAFIYIMYILCFPFEV